MSFNRQAIAQLEVAELSALLASAGAEIVRAHKPAGASWRVTIAHRNGESVGHSDGFVGALIDAVLACEYAGGLEFQARGAA